MATLIKLIIILMGPSFITGADFANKRIQLLFSETGERLNLKLSIWVFGGYHTVLGQTSYLDSTYLNRRSDSVSRGVLNFLTPS
jgi:hypothetical protein